MLLAVCPLFRALHRDGEDGVTPGAVGVHLGAADGAVLVAHGHDAVHVVGVVHHEGGEVLDVDADVGALLDLQTQGLVLAQEISDLFVVNLEI